VLPNGIELESWNQAGAEEHENASRAGEVLDGKYQLLRKVGEGGMGEVYEARHVQLGRRFAVKVLHPELVASTRMLRRFSREVLAVSRLENDHLVPALDCGYTREGGPYYVMEFLRGEDLRKLLHAQAPLATRRAVKLVIDACRGLTLAHASGLVHRDLKPENVFVVHRDDGEERARVLDFGLVQLGSGSSSSQLGSLVGTIRYMAPEQARTDSSVDQRADVYALGAILYECLCGKPPHAGECVEEVLFHRMNDAPEPLSALRPGIPEALERCVFKALARSRDDRFDNALELARALLPFAGPEVGAIETSYTLRAPDAPPETEITSDLAEAPRPPRESAGFRRRGMAIAVASALAAVLATHVLDRYVIGDSSRSAASPRENSAQPSRTPPSAPRVTGETQRLDPTPESTARREPHAAVKLEPPHSSPRSTAAPRRSGAAPLRTAERREPAADSAATPSALFDSTNPYIRSAKTLP
jgi:serine/threonine-protein kinase